MADDLDDSTRQLLDRLEIIDVLNRYAIAIDSRNWALFRELFVADVTAEYPGADSWTDLDCWTRDFEKIHEQYAATQHLITNHVVDVSDDGTARALSYGHARFYAPGPKPGARIVGVYYDDDLTKAGGRWKISHRTCRVMWRTDPSSTEVIEPIWHARADGLVRFFASH